MVDVPWSVVTRASRTTSGSRIAAFDTDGLATCFVAYRWSYAHVFDSCRLKRVGAEGANNAS